MIFLEGAVIVFFLFYSFWLDGIMFLQGKKKKVEGVFKNKRQAKPLEN